MPRISIGKRSCFYQDRGTGFPILFGHSYLWTSDMWEPQLNFLSKEFRCIAVDLWNHGQSDCIDANYSIEQLADDYWNFMMRLGIFEFAIIGLSVGGMWGTHLALKHQEAVRALVLMDTFVGSEPEETKQKYFRLLDYLAKEGFTNTLLDQLIPLFFSPRTFIDHPKVVLDFRKALSATKKENIPGIVLLGKAIFLRNCLLNQLPLLKIPSLVLVGRDDIPRPPQEAEKMAYLLQTDIRILDHAGHISNLEQPDVVNSHLLNFLTTSLIASV